MIWGTDTAACCELLLTRAPACVEGSALTEACKQAYATLPYLAFQMASS